MNMLNYLDFETSDDGEGVTTYDAMAYASAERWPALHAEVEQVLAWCTQEFGAPGPLDHGKAWDLDVQLQSDVGHALTVRWDAQQKILAAPEVNGVEAVQLSLTISGEDAWARAVVRHFSQNR